MHRDSLMKITPLIRILSITLLTAAFASLQAAPVTYQGTLSGAAEFPANPSLGTGTATVIVDSVAHTMQVLVTFSGLTGLTTAAHIHAATAIAGDGTAGVATQLPTFAGFPLTVTSGSYDNTYDTLLAGTWNPAYVTANGGSVAAAESVFFQSLADGKAYLNVHTDVYRGGEIRTFLNRVPDAGATLSLLAISLGGLAFAARRSPRRAV
jgi:hypothetical protein